MDRWEKRYASKSHFLEVLHISASSLQTKLLKRFFGFDRIREESAIVLLLTEELRKNMKYYIPMQSASNLREDQTSAAS